MSGGARGDGGRSDGGRSDGARSHGARNDGARNNDGSGPDGSGGDASLGDAAGADATCGGPAAEQGWPVWFDGALAEHPPAWVDPDLLLGNALFETLACVDGEPRRLAAHLDRLARAARSLGRPDPPRAALEAAARALAGRLPAARGALRLTLFDGGRRCLGTTRPIPAPPAEGVALWAAPPSVRARDPLESIKHSSRADKLHRRERARAAGAWDALLSNTLGRPVETTVANLWAVLDGRLVTPPIHEGCLPGVVRAELLALGRLELAPGGTTIAVGVAPLAAEDLARAAELLVTNSLVGVLGVRRLDRDGHLRELPGSEGAVARAAARALADPAGSHAVGASPTTRA